MDFVTFDFETANSDRGSACQIGITVVQGLEIVDSKEFLIRPEPNYFDSFNVYLHGIDEYQVRSSPTFGELWPDLQPYFESRFLFAHNAGFDFSVLRRALDQYGIEYPNCEYSCTYQIAKQVWTGLLSYRLNDLCSVLGIIQQNHHHAKYDAMACAEIAIKVMKELSIPRAEELPRYLSIRTGQLFPNGYKPSIKTFNKERLQISTLEYDSTKARPENCFYNSKVVFTGTLQSMSRRDAQKIVLEIGGKCQDVITNNTRFLIIGEQDVKKYRNGFKSNKMKKAEKILGDGGEIEILSERQFLEMINE